MPTVYETKNAMPTCDVGTANPQAKTIGDKIANLEGQQNDIAQMVMEIEYRLSSMPPGDVYNPTADPQGYEDRLGALVERNKTIIKMMDNILGRL